MRAVGQCIVGDVFHSLTERCLKSTAQSGRQDLLTRIAIQALQMRVLATAGISVGVSHGFLAMGARSSHQLSKRGHACWCVLHSSSLCTLSSVTYTRKLRIRYITVL
jgi:hypothetical protein